MDRLEDTLGYINEMELGKCKSNRAAFDFYDFINNAYIVIDCIKTIGHIFGVDNHLIEDIEDSSLVFGSKASSDGRYFEYVRSLCAVHPLCTSHQNEFLNGRQFHCCPFVTWRDNPCCAGSINADLAALIYSSNQRDRPFYLGLYVSQFERYLEKWISLIPNIIEAKNKYADGEYDRLRSEPIKTLSDYSNDVVQYLAYLKDEYCKRFDYGGDYLFDHFARVFTVEVSDGRNKMLLTKYRNAIIYSLQFERNALQNMSYEGYDNTGIKYPDRGIETTLFDSLDDPSTYESAFSPYSYNLGKLSYLEDGCNNYYNKIYARHLLEPLKELINQYVSFTNQESDEETLVLVDLALYLEALTRKCLLNKNIPNEPSFRVNVLTDDQYSSIFVEEALDENENNSTDVLQQLIEKYGGISHGEVEKL